MKRRRKLKQRDLLTKHEIKKIIDVAKNIRDKALISILIESGARIVEFLTLKVKDVKFGNHKAILTIRNMSSNSIREVQLKKSVPYIKKWIKSHPLNNDPNAPLWVTKDCKPLNSPIVRKVLRSFAKKARTKKKVVPHNFRYMRALYLLKKKNVG